MGADYPPLLSTYRSLAERAVSAHDGAVFGSEGDGLFAAFSEAGAAASAAIQAQTASSGESWPGNVDTYDVVRDRTQAVLRAFELGLMGSE